MTKESRLTALDSLRGFGILLVVLGHTSQTSGLVSWIFSFHMPLFFIISGMLFHERQFLDSFKRKAVRLLVPYVFFGTVTLAYWALIERRLRGDDGSVPNALANIVLAHAGVDNYPQNAVLWFLPCLFVTEMLFLGFFLLVNKAGSVETRIVMGGGWRNRIAVMALALVSFLSIIVMWSLDLSVEQFRLPWALDILPFSMLFYCIGYLLSEFILPHVQQVSQTQTLAHIAFAVVSVAGLYLLWLFDGWTKLEVNLNGASTNNPFWMLCAAMLGFVSSLMLCIAIDCRALRFLGRTSLTIMCVHEPVKRMMIFIMAKIVGVSTGALRANFVYALLVTAITVLICIVAHLILDKIAPALVGNPVR